MLNQNHSWLVLSRTMHKSVITFLYGCSLDWLLSDVNITLRPDARALQVTSAWACSPAFFSMKNYTVGEQNVPSRFFYDESFQKWDVFVFKTTWLWVKFIQK